MAPSRDTEALSEILPLLKTDDNDSVKTVDSKGKPATNGATKSEETACHVGMECDIKNLYSKEDERGRVTWTEKVNFPAFDFGISARSCPSPPRMI